MRLNKFLAKSGIASRRAADLILSQGRIAVNGEIVTKLGLVIDEALDKVTLDGKPVEISQERFYLALNKPSGYLVTAKDDFNRPIIFDLMGRYKSLVKPVGRLDYDSSGLIILTNDGELAFRLSHPRYEIDKKYLIKIEGNLRDNEINMLEKGIKLDDGMTSPAKVELISRNDKFSRFYMVIHEGRKRQIRRMCKAMGKNVVLLKRVAIGKLELGELKSGKFRRLNDEEVYELKKAVRL